MPTAEDSDDSYEEELDVAIDRLLNLIEEMESLSPQQAELLERIWKGVGSARLEWKKILDEFLQEEVNDYSFPQIGVLPTADSSFRISIRQSVP